MGSIFKKYQRKISYASIGGGCVKSKMQGGWVGQKCGDFQRTYFLDAPFAASQTVNKKELHANVKVNEEDDIQRHTMNDIQYTLNA